jgi:hypothetical protein
MLCYLVCRNFFQLTIYQMGVLGLCSFIVACRLDAMKSAFLYFKLFSFGIILLHNSVVCFIIFFLYC